MILNGEVNRRQIIQVWVYQVVQMLLKWLLVVFRLMKQEKVREWRQRQELRQHQKLVPITTG